MENIFLVSSAIWSSSSSCGYNSIPSLWNWNRWQALHHQWEESLQYQISWFTYFGILLAAVASIWYFRGITFCSHLSCAVPYSAEAGELHSDLWRWPASSQTSEMWFLSSLYIGLCITARILRILLFMLIRARSSPLLVLMKLCSYIIK